MKAEDQKNINYALRRFVLLMLSTIMLSSVNAVDLTSFEKSGQKSEAPTQHLSQTK